jgi:septum formation protein
VTSGVDESAVLQRLRKSGAPAGPRQVALHLARAKAVAVATNMPDAVVIGSDQVLALGDDMFSKSADRDAARRTLATLRGRRHELHSAVVAMRGHHELGSVVDSARLDVRNFSDAFLERYLEAAGDALTTCVGCYRLEGPGIQLFDRIDGDFHTILGMPLLPLLDILRRHGVIPA